MKKTTKSNIPSPDQLTYKLKVGDRPDALPPALRAYFDEKHSRAREFMKNHPVPDHLFKSE